MYKWMALAFMIVFAVTAWLVLSDRDVQTPLPEPAAVETLSPEPTPPESPPTTPMPSPLPAPDSSSDDPEAVEGVQGEAAILRIHGMVLDAATDAPIAQATLYIAGRDTRKVEVRSRDTGEYVLDIALKDYWSTRNALRAVHCEGKGYAKSSKPLLNLDLPSTEEAAPGAILEERLDFFLQPGATMAGRVFDANTNQGIPEVRVMAEDTTLSLMESMQQTRTTLDQAMTDADGNFTIDTLAPGSYRVVANAKSTGYVQQTGKPVTLSIAAGEHKSGVALPMTLGGTVRGTVRNAQGTPVQGASISIQPGNVMEMAMEIASDGMRAIRDLQGIVVRSDEQGAYEITALPLDHALRVRASAEQLTTSSSSVFKFTETKKTETIDLMLTRGSSVSGTARFEDGSSARNTKLSLMPDFGRMMQGEAMDPRQVETDADGAFQILALNAGKYNLRANVMMSGLNPFENQAHVLNFEVDGVKDLGGLVLVLKRDEELAGNLGDGKVLRGTVLDHRGGPARGVRVRATATTDPQDRPTGMTKEDGTFSIAGLKSNAYNLRVESDIGNGKLDNVSVASEPTIRLSAPTPLSGVVVDAEGRAVLGCLVQLLPTMAETPQFDPAALQRRILGGEDASSTKTDEYGFFAFKNVDAGDYTIKARSTTKGSAMHEVTLHAGRAETGLRIMLRPGIRFSGRVLDATRAPLAGATISLSETDPVGGIDLGPFLPDFMQQKDYTAVSDAQGNFGFKNVAPATYALQAELTPYAPTSVRDLVVSTGKNITGYIVTLLAGGTAEGTVLIDGVAKDGVMVQLMGQGGLKMTSTDQEGFFRIEKIPPGSYMAQASDMERLTRGDISGMIGPRSVEIRAGETTYVDFSPPPGSVTVSGHIGGELRALTMLTLRREGGPAPGDYAPTDIAAAIAATEFQAGHAIVQPDGTFEMQGIAPGTYILEVFGIEDPGNMAAMMQTAPMPLVQESVEVVPGVAPTFQFNLPPR